ncbi:MAG: hypothetical protein ACI8TQ_002790 [Planctomycetota bacterium]|jgi:hypothetical protein
MGRMPLSILKRKEADKVADETIKPPISIKRMALRLAIATAVLGLAALAFWLTVGMRFVPTSERTLSEGMCLAGATAIGPFGMLLGSFVNLARDISIICGVVAILLAVSVIWRRIAIARIAGYAGIAFWFFIGLIATEKFVT